MLRELGEDVPEETAETHEVDHWILTYFAAIQPGRCGNILDQPIWLYDVAIIGDAVVGEAERHAIEKASKKGKH